MNPLQNIRLTGIFNKIVFDGDTFILYKFKTEHGHTLLIGANKNKIEQLNVELKKECDIKIKIDARTKENKDGHTIYTNKIYLVDYKKEENSKLVQAGH